MRRHFVISATFLFLLGLMLGCNRQGKKNDDDKKDAVVDPGIKVLPPKHGQPKIKDDNASKKVIVKLPDLKLEQYEAAVRDGLEATAARNWQGALGQFEIAKNLDNNDFVQSQITYLKGRIDADNAVKTTAKDIETVLNDGKAEDAAKLAADALKEFGDGDDADRLIALRLQAEAVRAAETEEKADARYTRFRKEAEQALDDKNLRAAALAFEQALLARDDADLKKTYDGVRAKLDQYDALRKQAKEWRGDPLRQDDALAALKEAKAAWDTLQIRQEIDDCTLALQKRRDTVSIADFEVRNDVGIANAGATLADELLPLLKDKFDPVERGQLQRTLAELNLPGIPDDAKQQRKIGKLAGVRYLVVGSVHRAIGVSVKARLIDLETGLVVQTAKVIAPSIDEALDQMKDLARQLMQADEANLKADVNAGAQPAVVADGAVLPPAPAAPDAKAPPPPPEMINARPPGFGNAKAAVFANLAPAPDGEVAPPLDPLAVQQRNRLLFAAVEMGDFLFRAGRFAEAQQQFQFALTLAPDNLDVRARLQQVALLVPPLNPLTPMMPARPRLAVLPFMTVGDPVLVPPSMTWWAPTNLAPYFTWGGYDVVDSADLYWYMGRMGITMNDLLVDPIARRWLARAVGVRYFVFGSCVQTNSFDVNTYLVDTELGTMQGFAKINVQNWWELKLRMPELAQITMMSPADRMVYLAQQQQADFFRLMNLGQRHMTQSEYRKAADDFAKALLIYPDNVQAQVNLWLANVQARNQEAERERRQFWDGQQAAWTAARQRQIAITQASQQARKTAIASAAARTPAQQAVHLRFRLDGRATLVVQAQAALKTNRFAMSVSLFQSAAAFTPVTPPSTPLPAIDPVAMAKARAQAANAQALSIAQFTAARETARANANEKALTDTRAQLDAEKARNQKQLEQIRSLQSQRDLDIYQAGVKKGQELMAQKKFDAALISFQSAQRVASTAKQQDEINLYINVVVQGRADQTDPKLAAKLAADNERRHLLDTKAREKVAKYQAALQAAQDAMSLARQTSRQFAYEKILDDAEAKYLEAGKLFDTDAVRTGLKMVNSARADLANAKQPPAKDDGKKAKLDALMADYQAALKAGEKSLLGKDYKAALASFQQALKLMPDDQKASQYLKQAQQGLDAQTKTAVAFQAAIDAGEKAMTAKKYDAAVKSFTEATKLDPGSAAARTSLQRAQQALGDTQAQANYQKAMTAGNTALLGKKYDDAVKAFSSALKAQPNDQKAMQQLVQAQQLLQDSMKLKTPPADPNKAFTDAMQRGAAAEKKENYADAAKAFNEALKLRPKDADANAGWKKNQFNLNMQQGQQFLDNMMWVDAQREFEAALKLVPNNPNALKLLQKAKNKGK
jgi:tetratricopeptide (TPR) repeat protein